MRLSEIADALDGAVMVLADVREEAGDARLDLVIAALDRCREEVESMWEAESA